VSFHFQKDEVLHSDTKLLADLMLDVLDRRALDKVLLVLKSDEEGCRLLVSCDGLLDTPSCWLNWLWRHNWLDFLRDSSHLEIVRFWVCWVW